MKMNGVEVKHIELAKIPVTIIEPKEKNGKGLIWYHGWGAERKSQEFRCNTFASFGYTVLMPDSPYHGERGTVDYDDEKSMKEFMPKSIVETMDEFPTLIKEFSQYAEIPEGEIFVSGHSMGGMVSGAIVANYPQAKGAIPFNGILDWNGFLEGFQEGDTDAEVKEAFEAYNPIGHLDTLADRPLCMLNGENDTNISAKGQEAFYKEAKKFYKDDEKIYFEAFGQTGHVTTTNMMEVAVNFMEKM
ncbi:prolyl oligopeptidase family serine peptidase [Peptoniphilus sp. KCTC 25270]|uniref:alpha/beta hydrolase family protein n=1 Tax=Peptoniphilus sp. KCTC 25270 TaxID=2897414 RepID=UPI001E562655|nr:prolyl oligopeptidase family serine peptidase [Peptoniphilus sp. KCTC 25270]MCD1147975.1 prolyl oligopeptidase family serine peptidase [Peptoniphilus sp. KCTC 25270]